jgi:hypothetical protein
MNKNMNNSLHLTVITLLLAAFKLSAATLYVSLGSTNPTTPYTNWATAATNIQDAVDAAAAGDRILVTNGVYATGGRAAGTGDSDNRVLVTKAVTLLSVNGPQFTIIRGDQVMIPAPPPGYGYQNVGPRCVYLTDGAVLSGFTLYNGLAYAGGGVSCTSTNAVVTNCVIMGNSAPGWTADGSGGGAVGGALYNCTLTGNYASFMGGGAAYCTLYNCTLTGNWAIAKYGTAGGAVRSTLYNCSLTGNSAPLTGGGVGGVSQSTLYNCILRFNKVPPYESNADSSSTLNYCWAASDPLFVDYTNGNLRLQSNSPCINAGNNAYVTTATDLDGRPRIVGGTVDMGGYEFQPGVSGAFIGWLQGYGLLTDGSADSADADGDGMNNWQEWVCGTCPTNPLSALRLLSATPRGTNVTVSWQSVAGVNYFLKRSANLASPFTLVATNIIGQAGTTTYGDTNATGAGPFFYRVGVNSP